MPDEPFEQPVRAAADAHGSGVDGAAAAQLESVGTEGRLAHVIHRRAGRILLLDPHDRVLLSHDTWNGEHWWTTPGGGIEAGEDARDAALREVTEETGFTDVQLGPLVMRHHWRAMFYDYWLDQHELIYLGRSAGGEPDTSGLLGIEKEFMLGFQWWTAPDLLATTDTIYPPHLPDVLAQILAEGPPATPVDDGEWELPD